MHVLRALSLISRTAQIKENKLESLIQRFECLLQACFHYRSFHSLCSGSNGWVQGALQTVFQAGQHLIHKPPGLHSQEQQTFKPRGDPECIREYGHKQNTEFCMGWEELSCLGTLPAGLRPHLAIH